MATFIKAGFWEKLCTPCKGYKGWLNLDSLIQSIVQQNIQPNYKIYRALIYQEDDNDPTAIVLENTFGFDFNWTRTDTGQYSVYNEVFDIEKTHYFINGTFTPDEAFASMYFLVDTVNGINITTTNSEEWPPVQSDNKLYYTPVEIRVYN